MDIKDKDFGKVENYQSHITSTVNLTPLKEVYEKYGYLYKNPNNYFDCIQIIIITDLLNAIKEVLKK